MPLLLFFVVAVAVAFVVVVFGGGGACASLAVAAPFPSAQVHVRQWKLWHNPIQLGDQVLLPLLLLLPSLMPGG